MMQLKCIAIDDEPLALSLIQEFAGRFPSLKLSQVFDDALAGAAFLRNNPVDLLFVDINMPDLNGLELVRSLAYKPMIVFTTAYRKFAVEAYDLDAIDYLLKPIEFERFAKAVNKAIEYEQFKRSRANSQESIFVRSEYQLVKIDLADIEYIESMEDYLKIHLLSGKPVMTLMTMKSLLEKLPGDKFRRIHRSYVIAVSQVRYILNRKVKLNTAELPVSESYVDELKKWMNQ